jgi:hypothetical protein
MASLTELIRVRLHPMFWDIYIFSLFPWREKEALSSSILRLNKVQTS